MRNKIFGIATVLLLVAFTGCSNMIEDLKVRNGDGPSVVVNVTVSRDNFALTSVTSGNIVTFTVITPLEPGFYKWYLDGIEKSSDSQHPESYQIDKTSLSAGTHLVQVATVVGGIAYDAEATITKSN